ncbi:MAG: TrpR YerC/YecD [Eggerthellaceae bacterium]|nr:TrpR YerC/YecD [Eggerthellaceae bacterium]
MSVNRNAAYLDELYRALAVLDDPKDVEALLIDLCTTTEVDELANRLAVARLLAAGKSYTVIQKTTGASAATIARVSKFLSEGAGGYAKVLAKIAEREDED